MRGEILATVQASLIVTCLTYSPLVLRGHVQIRLQVCMVYIHQRVDILKKQINDNMMYWVWTTAAEAFAFSPDVDETVAVSAIFKQINNKYVSWV